MHPKKIQEKINTITAYQHICHIQLQKAQTNHDFSDLLTHYQDKIKAYETQVIKLEEQLVKETKKRLIVGLASAKLAIIAIFVVVNIL